MTKTWLSKIFIIKLRYIQIKLEYIVETENMALIIHPVILKLVKLKWALLAR